MKEAIVAYDLNRAIGYGNDLLWDKRDLPADMARFRRITLGRRVIMGLRTFQSIGQPLPRRENIVLTRRDITVPGTVVVHSVEDALDYAGDDFVCIGGAQIYEQMLYAVDRLYATEVRHRFSPVDTYFPPLGSAWQEAERAMYRPDEHNRYAYDFVEYTKLPPAL